jgi:hypothetical protein
MRLGRARRNYKAPAELRQRVQSSYEMQLVWGFCAVLHRKSRIAYIAADNAASRSA